MPPKKKNKGKDKKAKWKPRPGGRSWEVWAAGGRDKALLVKCGHGTGNDGVIPERVAKLLDSFQDEIDLSPNGYTMKSLIGAAFHEHEAVWENEQLRQQAIDLFVRIGTNMCNGNARSSPAITRYIAAAALVLENYDGDINTTYITVDPKLRDLIDSDNNCVSRDVIRFFKKRITCNCLDQRYSYAKDGPKLGVCKTCGQQKERSSFQVCGSCKIAHYCCRQCQVQDWPTHKSDCAINLAVRGGNPLFKGMFDVMIPKPTGKRG